MQCFQCPECQITVGLPGVSFECKVVEASQRDIGTGVEIAGCQFGVKTIGTAQHVVVRTVEVHVRIAVEQFHPFEGIGQRKRIPPPFCVTEGGSPGRQRVFEEQPPGIFVVRDGEIEQVEQDTAGCRHSSGCNRSRKTEKTVEHLSGTHVPRLLLAGIDHIVGFARERMEFGEQPALLVYPAAVTDVLLHGLEQFVALTDTGCLHG